MQISLSGVKEFEGNLTRIQEVVNDFSPELRTIGEWFIDFTTNDVFLTDGGEINEDWAELNPRYKNRKKEIYPGRGTLEASGTMRTSWKLYTTSHYALIENATEYAKYHQEGTGRLPQRMFVKLDQERQDTIIDMFREGILKRIQNAIR